MTKQYITDETGKVKSVILDYELYSEVEDLIEDYLLGKILTDSEEDVEISISSAKNILKQD